MTLTPDSVNVSTSAQSPCAGLLQTFSLACVTCDVIGWLSITRLDLQIFENLCLFIYVFYFAAHRDLPVSREVCVCRISTGVI